MLSLIVVILVGICFTRLTMLALEMRDDEEVEYGGTVPAETLLRKEILLSRMKTMKKPKSLQIVGEDQCKRTLDNIDDDSGTSDEEEALSLDNATNTTMPLEKEISKENKLDTSKDIAILVTAGKNENEEDNSIDVDPNDLCIICFERSKNAVFLECGHGGVCYNCAIDTCIVTGKCPLCRDSIKQIVTVATKGTLKWSGKIDSESPEVVPVIGPI